MIADPNESESKAKTIAGQLPNRLPMRDSALRATSGLCTEARCCISSPNHEIAIIEIGLPSDPRPMICPPIGMRVRSRRGHLDNRPTRRIAGNWWYGYTSPRQCTREDGSWIISGSIHSPDACLLLIRIGVSEPRAGLERGVAGLVGIEGA